MKCKSDNVAPSFFANIIAEPFAVGGLVVYLKRFPKPPVAITIFEKIQP